MATVNDFINTFFTVRNLQLTQQQLAQQVVRDRAGAISIMNDALSNITDADIRVQAAQGLGEAMGLDQNQIEAFARARTPNAAAVGTGNIQRGQDALGADRLSALEQLAATQNLTGMTPTGVDLEQRTGNLMLGGIDNLEQQGIGIDSIMAMRQLFGQTPGQFAVDQAGAGLPASEQAEAARIGYGLAPDAGQVLGATTQAAGIRASMQGNLLDYNARMAGLNAAANQESGQTQPFMAPKDLQDNILSMVGQLREGGLSESGADFLQRSIASNVTMLLQSPLNPYGDVYPGNPRPGETQEQHMSRAIGEIVERITGQRFRARSFGEAVIPGGN